MSTSSPLQDLHAELQERVAEGAARLDIPGVAVGIYLAGQEDYVCHGVTSLPNPLPVDEHTLFQIGSTTKTFVGTAMMVLVERGLVDLSAPVRRYLPDFRLQDEAVAANVTVLHLLNHTAGWAGDFFIDTGYGEDSLARFVARLVEANQERPLGERVSYNNAALGVAGRVLEVVTGQSFEDAIKTLVYEPLGLTEHFFFPWEIMTRRFAAGHARHGDTLRVTPWYVPRGDHPPGGEHSASARDQIRYARFHLSDGWGVLRPETLRQMQTLTTPSADTSQAQEFGISWMLRDIDGVQVVSHGGSTGGHQSGFEMVPERDFAIITLTNASHGTELVIELRNWAFEAYAGVVERIPDPLPLTAAELAEYVGAYEAHNGVLQVTVAGDLLVANLEVNPDTADTGQDPEESMPPIPFKILPENQFLIVEGQYKGLRGGIIRDANGHISGLDIGRVFTRRT